ncbi:MAG TPA: CdaR family protein [Candidatus Baltobacteraceae bacterium]|nr:CdaR family protein [Candidatus Baltobacteraceae bacterium]
MANHKWIAEDFYWKIFSVILAVVVWLTVHNIRDEPVATGILAVQNTFTNVPVLAVSADTDMRNVHVTPDSVSITVSGSPDIIAILQTNQLHAFVNLTGIDSSYDLKRHVDIAPPLGVTLLNVDPPEVTVTIPATK